MEQYQDIWIKGKLKAKGIREVESRYELIKSVASKYKRPFTVLDIGANLGYFSIRLAEDFPDCTVVAIEGIYGNWLKQVLVENDNKRILLLKQTFDLNSLRTLSEVEHFDMVLAMSVIHHIPGGFDNVLEVVRSLGETVVAEIATEDGACGQSSVKAGYIPNDAEVIGHGRSHLNGPPRPVFVMKQKKNTLKKSYLTTPRADSHELEIESNFFVKKKHQRGRTYDWHRGINLRTFINYWGRYPSRDYIVSLLEKRRPKEKHGDLTVHNTILQGDDVQFIDWYDPGINVLDDDRTFAEMLKELREVE